MKKKVYLHNQINKKKLIIRPFLLILYMAFLHLNHMEDKKAFYIARFKRRPLIRGHQTICNRYCLFITDFLFSSLSVITDTLHYHLYTCINRANLGGRSYDFDSMFRYANWRVITRTTRYGWNIKKKKATQ